MDTCKTLGGTLPARSDFERGEANGFREVVPNMKDRWFWSSSVGPSSFDGADGFSGNDGFIDVGYRSYTDSVRCVAR